MTPEQKEDLLNAIIAVAEAAVSEASDSRNEDYSGMDKHRAKTQLQQALDQAFPDNLQP